MWIGVGIGLVLFFAFVVPLLGLMCSRTASQNVSFNGDSPGDDPYEPPGRGITKLLLRSLRTEGFEAADEDNWRDSGWSIDLSVSGATLQLACARTGEQAKWIIQIAVLNEPGFFGRLIGKRFVDRSTEVLAVSRAVHNCLRQAGYTDILWRKDGFPDPANSTPEPIAPS